MNSSQGSEFGRQIQRADAGCGRQSDRGSAVHLFRSFAVQKPAVGPALPLYLVKAQGYSLSAMAEPGGLVYVLSATISLGAGALADRWMARDASSNRARKTLIGAAGAIGIVSMLMCAFGDLKLAVAGLLLSSLCGGVRSFNLYAIAQTLAGPTAAGKWVGLQNCIGNISGIVAPLITGIVVDMTGHFTWAFVLAASISGMGLFCWTIGIGRIEPIAWRGVGSSMTATAASARMNTAHPV